MKKLLSLLGAIGLVATSSATVVSCDNGDKDSSNAGDFTTDLSKVAGDKTDDLVEVIKTQFKDTDGIADARVMIFDTIDNANKAEDVMTGAADKTDLPTEVDKITGEEASLAFFAFAIDKDTSDYSATVLKGTITNEKAAPVEAKDLKDVVKTLELGTIADKKPATILAAINKANSSSLTDKDVTIDAITDTGATVTPKEDSKLVKGEAVTVTFKIGAEDKTVELNTIITDGALGKIATADEAGVKAALTDKFPNLKQGEITIKDVTNTTATIAAKDGSTVYSGSVDVTFTVA